MTRLVLDDHLNKSRLHVETFESSKLIMLAIEPERNLDTGEIWLTKSKLEKLLESLTNIYNEMKNDNE